MLWCVMDLQPVCQPECLLGRESLIQRSNRMRVEVIHNQNNFLRIRVLLIQHPSDLLRPVLPGAVFLGIGIPSTAKRFREHEDACGSITDVFIIFIFNAAIL